MILLALLISIGCISGELLSENLSLLGSNSKIPRLGLGTAGMRHKTREAVYSALLNGVSLIDTAQANEWYDEVSVGRGIDDYFKYANQSRFQSPKDIFIVTKIHPRSFQLDKMNSRTELSVRSLLRVSGVDGPIDAILLHSSRCWEGHCSPEEEQVSWKTGWKNLEELRAAGVVTNIGVSNFHMDILRELESISTAPVAIIQNWMDPFNQDKEVRSYCQEKGIVYMSYSSFGTQWEWKLGHNPVFYNPVLQNIANKHSTTIAKVVLSWLLQEGVVVIPRSATEEHIAENASPLVFDDNGKVTGMQVFLDENDMQAVRDLDGILGNLWDERTDL